MANIGDTLDIEIIKIVPRGFGMAFAEGLTVFVPLSAPGDKLRVRIEQKKKKIAFAEIAEVLEPSPQRTSPPCRYFGSCGGCDFQQMSYSHQLDAKLAIIRDSLKRIGNIEYPSGIEILPSPRPLNYRSRVQWHAEPQSRKIGYFRRNSHKVIDIEDCPILVPELNATLARIRTDTQWENIWDTTADIEASVGDNGEVSISSGDLAEAARELTFEAAGEKYSFSAAVFFQGNQMLIEPLIKAATAGLAGKNAVDLYSGVGLFTLPLARKFEHVIAVEESPAAAVYAEKNASTAGLANVEIIRANVDSMFKRNEITDIDLVLLDPPRSGADVATIHAIARARPPHISYVSCDPSILARDLRIFLDHGYSIDSMTAFDLFPQTHHVETVARLNIADPGPAFETFNRLPSLHLNKGEPVN